MLSTLLRLSQRSPRVSIIFVGKIKGIGSIDSFVKTSKSVESSLREGIEGKESSCREPGEKTSESSKSSKSCL